MKKCGIFAIAALVTILCGRLNAAVESDIVGYTTTTIQGKKADGSSSWYQIAIQFKGLGETEDKIKISEAINVNGLTPTTWSGRNSAPCMQVYNGRGYDYYYYITDAYVDSESDDQLTGWANKDQELASNNYLKLGDAVWFKADGISTGSTGTITVAGVVSLAEEAKTLNVDGALELFSNPYPVDLCIKDIACSLTPTTWSERKSAPCIQVYNGKGYDYYYYITDAYVDSESDDQIKGWADKNQEITNVTISAGTGFWLKTSGNESGTLTFTLK